MTVIPTVRPFEDIDSFIDRAGPWLSASEAEHSLLLGIIGQLRSGRHTYGEPVLLATIEQDGAVVGCAFRTPPYKLGVTRMPQEAIPALVDAIGKLYTVIPAVLGPEMVATAVAEEWADRFGGSVQPGMRQRIYQTDRVEPPTNPASGKMRLATPDDRDLVFEWLGAFVADVGVEAHDIERLANQVIDGGGMGLWMDNEQPRSMAAASGATASGIRIGYVYTPPRWRGYGYGSAVTAAVTQRQFDKGFKWCSLYTDLSNPTSNDIYQRIGFRPVCDVVDVTIVP